MALVAHQFEPPESPILISQSALLPIKGSDLPSKHAPEAPKLAHTATSTPKVAIAPSDHIEALIRAEFPDAPVMVKVALCESGNHTKHGCIGPINPQADNPKSTAYGVFQILEGTWRDHGCTGNRGNAQDNIKCARKIYDRSGTAPWNASKYAWN